MATSLAIEPVIDGTPWGDIEGSVRGVDQTILRFREVLSPELASLDAGWPAWLNGRESDEDSVDATKLDDGDRLLLAAALLHDLHINWGKRETAHGNNARDVLVALLEVLPRHDSFELPVRVKYPRGSEASPKDWDGDTDSLPPLDQIEEWSRDDFEIFESKFEAFWAGVALAEGGHEKWQRKTEES